jgi:hypothetical protein
MKAKTPQQKKRDSYSKDRRNAYGESNKGSRKSIRRRKRHPNRANRRNATTLLATAQGAAHVDALESVESRLDGKRPKRWQKAGDASLGSWVEGRLRRRAKLGIDDPSAVEARVRRVRRNAGR